MRIDGQAESFTAHRVSGRGSRIASAVLIIGALAALSGCGGSSGREEESTDSAVERSASVIPDYNTSCPELSGTKTIFGSVFNVVPGLGNLRIIVPQGSYDCFDWSGTSTPGKAFNGMGVGSGFPERFRLEASYRQYREADSGGPWTMEVVVPSRGGWESVSSRLAINAEANAVDRAKRTASGRTSWPGSSTQYRFYPISDTNISDSSPEVVRNACSKDWRNFGLGSYQGKLVWFFCSDF